MVQFQKLSTLEEIQQYREIGTVKEIKIREAQFARLSEGYLKDLSLLREYQSLGTVEEIQKAIENLPLHKVEHKLLQEYQNIGTVRLCKIAVERMKPKKPDYEADGYADGQLVYDYAKCPVCGHDFEYGINDWDCKYCSDCGQKLDWE